MNKLLEESIEAIVSLIKGMWITLKQMFSKPCTIQYPEERLVWPNRTRGRLVLPIDQKTGKNRCTVCMMCERICPNGSIEIKIKQEDNKRVLDNYLHYLGRCSYCGLCVEVCPFDALRMSHEHEIAVVDKTELDRQLQNETLVFDDNWQGGLPAKKDQNRKVS